jgi:hypothetical protein
MTRNPTARKEKNPPRSRARALKRSFCTLRGMELTWNMYFDDSWLARSALKLAQGVSQAKIKLSTTRFVSYSTSVSSIIASHSFVELLHSLEHRTSKHLRKTRSPRSAYSGKRASFPFPLTSILSTETYSRQLHQARSLASITSTLLQQPVLLPSVEIIINSR